MSTSGLVTSESPFAKATDLGRLNGVVVSDRELSTVEYLSRMSKDLLGAFDKRTFEDLIVERRFLWLSTFLVTDPNGIRRVLVDNASNYVRVDSLQPVLAPLVGNGLVASEGERWRAHRRLMIPAFDRASLNGYSIVMKDSIARLLARWDIQAPGEPLDIGAEMMQLTLDIIVQTTCSSDSNELRVLISDGVAKFFPQMKFSLWSVLPGVKHVWATRTRRRGQNALRSLNATLYDLIARRKQVPIDERPTDLLTRLIGTPAEGTPPQMTDCDIRDQLMTVITVGHETSAMALAWTWYVLSRYPEIEAGILTEIEGAIGSRTPTIDDLSQLSYTRMVLDEVLRMYPPVHSLGWRQAVADDEVCGQKISRGSIVTVVPWVVHRHPKLWDRPEEFIPERFTKEQQATRPRFSYIPFSVGPHVCLGSAFAITEMLLVLATILPKYRLKLVDAETVKPLGMVTLHSANQMRMKLEKR